MLLWSALAVIGCEKPAPHPESVPATSSIVSARGAKSIESDPAHPIEVCGPRGERAYLAKHFVCPDGSAAFGADGKPLRSTPVGAMGPGADGHMVDRYAIPCGSDTVEVFFDMYHCG